MSVTPALLKLRQEDYLEFKPSLREFQADLS